MLYKSPLHEWLSLLIKSSFSFFSPIMAPSLKQFLQAVLVIAPPAVRAQSSTAHTASSTTTSYRPLFTVPNEATVCGIRLEMCWHHSDNFIARCNTPPEHLRPRGQECPKRMPWIFREECQDLIYRIDRTTLPSRSCLQCLRHRHRNPGPTSRIPDRHQTTRQHQTLPHYQSKRKLVSSSR